MNLQQLSFPSRVIRGEAAVNQLGGQCAALGGRAMVIGGHRALAAVEQTVYGQLAAAGVTLAVFAWYGGECSETHIERLAKQARTEGIEVIIGIGGGKALDTAKATGNAVNRPVITLPTIAATCAAITPLSIRYSDEGHFRDLFPLPQAPATVIIDTRLLSASPLRWLAAGLGDTLAKWYEYRAIGRPGLFDGMSASASANSRICYDLIARYGRPACEALLRKAPSAALEQALDAIFVFAGLTSIMGRGAHAAAAHAVYEGFTVNDKTRNFGHGLLVGYGNLCLLALEGRDDAELLEAIRLARACSLPVRLAEIRGDLSPAERDAICLAAAQAPDMANMPKPVGSGDVDQAMRRVDSLAAAR
ncbi:iron-containing alcohol dehydrogenase family protein [Martelella alba]|uniref:Iron-containing alcohol dehydrogenase family protein n=1 Tax=Martelella alba TaxID=2590451 RepID=A0ABY2SH00_9HYPH|nr:iron-containing alcohol dehydrogenase family protein [Martelella alba]